MLIEQQAVQSVLLVLALRECRATDGRRVCCILRSCTPGASPKNEALWQRIRAEPVGSIDADARHFAGRV
jgi:hypothetical protein